MRKIFAAFRDLIRSYDKRLDPMERLVLRERFPPWPILALITGWMFLLLIMVLLFQLTATMHL